jgi:hypothetical protein
MSGLNASLYADIPVTPSPGKGPCENPHKARE